MNSRKGCVARTGIGTVVAGVLFVFVGGFFIAFPQAGVVPHHDAESGRYFPERVSKTESRIAGCVAVVLGSGLIWFGRWPRWGARRAAIEDYVWRLSQELSRHFGTKKYYSVQEVNLLAGECGCKIAYIAYAHAMFCNREDFDAYYGPLRLACTYDGLRDVISRLYFEGARGFDAATIVRRATPPREEEYEIHQDAAE